MAAGTGAAPTLSPVCWAEVLARLDYFARYAPADSPWRKQFLTAFRRMGGSKVRWIPVIDAMLDAGVLSDDEAFFCKAVLAMETAREVEPVNDQAPRPEDVLAQFGGEKMAALYVRNRAEFAKRFQRGAKVTARL